MKAVLIFMYFAMPSGVAAHPSPEPGTAAYVYAETVGANDIKVPVYFHWPETWQAEDGRISLVMHGAGRNGGHTERHGSARQMNFNAIGRSRVREGSISEILGLSAGQDVPAPGREYETAHRLDHLYVDRLIDDVFRRLGESPARFISTVIPAAVSLCIAT